MRAGSFLFQPMEVESWAEMGTAPLPGHEVWYRTQRRHIEADIQHALALVVKVAGQEYLPAERAQSTGTIE